MMLDLYRAIPESDGARRPREDDDQVDITPVRGRWSDSESGWAADSKIHPHRSTGCHVAHPRTPSSRVIPMTGPLTASSSLLQLTLHVAWRSIRLTLLVSQKAGRLRRVFKGLTKVVCVGGDGWGELPLQRGRVPDPAAMLRCPGESCWWGRPTSWYDGRRRCGRHRWRTKGRDVVGNLLDRILACTSSRLGPMVQLISFPRDPEAAQGHAIGVRITYALESSSGVRTSCPNRSSRHECEARVGPEASERGRGRRQRS